MAEYLLKGGKMLAKTCQNCGSPLFEYKGETSCVVCKESDLEAMGENKGDSVSRSHNTEPRFKNSETQISEMDINLDELFEQTFKYLLISIEEETNSRNIAELTHALKEVAEAYSILNQRYGNRDNS
ncbi:Sjogren's syndrome/scleroderma autoantigen 1 family protein [Methanospirillum lacunae]